MGQVILSGNGASSTSSGAVGIPPMPCRALREEKNGLNVSLSWKDPNNTVIDEQLICSWSHTIIVRKQGSYPENEKDGVVVVTNTVRNAYNLTPYVDVLPDSENEYYYKAFPVSVNGAVCLDTAGNFGDTIIFEYINLSNSESDSENCIVRTGKNAEYAPVQMNMTTGVMDYGDWVDAWFFDMFKPVMLNPNGTVKEYLCPTNLALQIDGVTASSVADTAQTANAMVQIGQIWIKETEIGGVKHVYIANKQIDSDYDCLTHLKPDGTYNEFVYEAIFEGSLVNGKIRSLSGQAINRSTAGNLQIQYCQANGTGWNARRYNVRRLLQHLGILIGNSLNFQDVFGTGRYTGYVSESNTGQILTTGTNNTKGMFTGDNNNGAVTFFYIQNYWGNNWELTNGLIQVGGKLKYKMCRGTLDGSTTQEYNATGDGYIDSGVTLAGTITALSIKKMSLIPKLGYVPNGDSGGSTSTYYCDGLWSNSTVVGFARFGGVPNIGLLCGVWALAVHVAVSDSSWSCGVSLSYEAS